MSVQVKNDLESFHRFVVEQLANGGAQFSPEQVLVMWRERLETIESIQHGLADIDAGRTRPADELFEELRNELQKR